MGEIIKKYCSIILKCFTYVVPFMWFSSRQIHMLSTLKFTISREKKQDYFSIIKSKILLILRNFLLVSAFQLIMQIHGSLWSATLKRNLSHLSSHSFLLFSLLPYLFFSPLSSFLFLVLELSIRCYLFDGRLYERIILVSYVQF